MNYETTRRRIIPETCFGASHRSCLQVDHFFLFSYSYRCFLLCLSAYFPLYILHFRSIVEETTCLAKSKPCGCVGVRTASEKEMGTKDRIFFYCFWRTEKKIYSTAIFFHLVIKKLTIKILRVHIVVQRSLLLRDSLHYGYGICILWRHYETSWKSQSLNFFFTS